MSTVTGLVAVEQGNIWIEEVRDTTPSDPVVVKEVFDPEQIEPDLTALPRLVLDESVPPEKQSGSERNEVPTDTSSPEPTPAQESLPKPAGSPSSPSAPSVAPGTPEQPEPVVTPRPKPVGLSFSEESCDRDRLSFGVYGDPTAQAIRLERDMRAYDPSTAALLRRIACIPHPTWVVGGEVDTIGGRIASRVQEAAALGKVPVIVIYSLPHGAQAQWGAKFVGGDYQAFIDAIAKGIGSREAWVVLEPDALPMSNQYSASEYKKRVAQLSDAVSSFAAHAPKTRVYLDAGHSRWINAERMAQILRDAGVERAHGFSLNVSNFQTTESNIAYGTSLATQLGGKRFVVDTSRNGNGPSADSEWCNASGRALGQVPTLSPGMPYVDGLLWIKPPGESDGWCNGGPQAGHFWMEYALGLIERS